MCCFFCSSCFMIMIRPNYQHPGNLQHLNPRLVSASSNEHRGWWGPAQPRCKELIDFLQASQATKHRGKKKKKQEDSVREHFDRIGAPPRLYLLGALLCTFNIFEKNETGLAEIQTIVDKYNRTCKVQAGARCRPAELSVCSSLQGHGCRCGKYK